MPTQVISSHGWARNLRLFNADAELLISLDVGPRVLTYRPVSGANVFHNFTDHLGTTGESEWKNRGGHRFWIAPEDIVLTYLPDNDPVPCSILSESSVRFSPPVHNSWQMRRELEITLAESGCGTTVRHILTNETDTKQQVAPWALSVMAPGGVSYLPQPAMGSHPEDLLPERALILWPYSNPKDPRFQYGKNLISLRHDDQPPFKFGLQHRQKWAAYHLGDQLFIKTVHFEQSANYPDLGCNYESYTDQDILEMETLGPLTTLAPGETVVHVEEWNLFSNVGNPIATDEASLMDWLQPFLPKL